MTWKSKLKLFMKNLKHYKFGILKPEIIFNLLPSLSFLSLYFFLLSPLPSPMTSLAHSPLSTNHTIAPPTILPPPFFSSDAILSPYNHGSSRGNPSLPRFISLSLSDHLSKLSFGKSRKPPKISTSATLSSLYKLHHYLKLG